MLYIFKTFVSLLCGHASYMSQQYVVDQGLLTIEASRSHSDTPHSVGLLWKSGQPDAETCTWRHTTLTRDRLPRPGGIRTHSLSKRAAADSLRQRGHWNPQWCEMPRGNTFTL